MPRPTVFLDWDMPGMHAAQRRRAVTIIVDVFSFSSCVVTAIANGYDIYPVSNRRRGATLAKRLNANLSGKRGISQYSLSPLTFTRANPTNNRVVLYSPNGAALVEASPAGTVVGAFLNAKAVACYAQRKALSSGRDIVVIVANEQRAAMTGKRVEYQTGAGRVFALEDYLAAGAIMANISFPKTPEAEVCEHSYEVHRKHRIALLSRTPSGLYLNQKQARKDLLFSVRENIYPVVPIVTGRAGVQKISLASKTPISH